VAYDMYQEIILNHYRSPRNFGPLPEANHSGEESNPLCGDHITMRLKIDPTTQKIEKIRFEGDGCAISMASASMLTQRIEGQTVDGAGRISQEDVLTGLGIPLSPVRTKCALTGYVALGRALHPEVFGTVAPRPTPAARTDG
jgi:nitrogen fixation NifU-like protein